MSFSEGYILDGRVLTVTDGTPAEAHYAVHAGPDWITRFAHIILLKGNFTERTEIRRNEDGSWWVDDQHHRELDGVLDVDLALSPATNTLPIRRLDLTIGESRGIDAAWVRFPQLTCERLTQRYTRLADRLYRYESSAGAFAADIHVDAEGVVTRYGDLWERVPL